MQDLVCTAAAGCDLAIADDKFRLTRDSASGTGMIPALHKMYNRALEEFPMFPETVGLLAIMEFQCARMIAAKLQVRALRLPQSLGCCCRLAGLLPDVS